MTWRLSLSGRRVRIGGRLGIREFGKFIPENGDQGKDQQDQATKRVHDPFLTKTREHTKDQKARTFEFQTGRGARKDSIAGIVEDAWGTNIAYAGQVVRLITSEDIVSPLVVQYRE